eukprot:TRINITY_DN1645_c6_g1_i1.p1 TRINITY_DN1645_c6_g1~~TRINITY_DN1645_c6_g1_i1.p1  ORF type:complete len:1406 (-),score=333.85 TRINITY_DN1645_c6_g1_i1:66-3776(-)
MSTQERLSTVWGLGYAGMRHNIYLSGSAPDHLRLHWRAQNANEGIVACIYYGIPNTVNVYVNGNLIKPKAVTTWDNQVLPKLDSSMPHGTNSYDRVGVETGRPGYLYVVLKGVNSVVDLKISHKVKLTAKVELASNLSFSGDGKVKRSAYWKKGINGLVRSIALQFGIPPNRISIVGNGTAKPGTFWNEKTTSKKFAAWMHKQNKTMDKMNRTELRKQMEALRKKKSASPGVAPSASLLETDSDEAVGEFMQQMVEAQNLLAEVQQLMEQHEKAAANGESLQVPSELKQAVKALADQVKACVGSPTMDALSKCIGHRHASQSKVAIGLSNIKGSLEAYFADKAKIEQMVQWQDKNSKGYKGVDPVDAHDPGAVGQAQIGGVLDAEKSAGQKLDMNKVDVVIDDDADETSNDVDPSAKPNEKKTSVATAKKIEGSNCTAGSCKPKVCPAGETCTPFSVEGTEVDGNLDRVPGWTCAASRYNGSDGCDCDCGVWDPDCDANLAPIRAAAFGIRDTEDDDINLLDREQTVHLMREVDYSSDFKIDEGELKRALPLLGDTNGLKTLAKRVMEAGDRFLSNLRWSASSSCKVPKSEDLKKSPGFFPSDLALYKGVCIKDNVKKIAGKAAARCALQPTFRHGTQCKLAPTFPGHQLQLGNPCTGGEECAASAGNTWDYKCGNDQVAQEQLHAGFIFEIYPRKQHGGGRRRRWGNLPALRKEIPQLSPEPNSKTTMRPKIDGGTTDVFTTPKSGDNYIGRVRARFLADVTGNYKFFLTADDQGILRMRSLEGAWQEIAVCRGATKDWNRWPEQTSKDIYLEGGTLTEIEGLFMEGGWGDFISIGVQLPGGKPQLPMPLKHLVMLPADVKLSSVGEAEVERAQAAFVGKIEGSFQKNKTAAVVNIPDKAGNTGAAGKLTMSFTCKKPKVKDITKGLVLDLRADKYDKSGTWKNQVSGGPDASVPKGIDFDPVEKAFIVKNRKVISVPIATNPKAMKDVTYSIWVKLGKGHRRKEWVMGQMPDYRWSRAITLNDHRLGGISITKGGHWNSGLGRAEQHQWIHVVGVWRQHGLCTVFKNGKKGASTQCNNGERFQAGEVLNIGGRQNGDWGHNPSEVKVSDVKVYNRALSDAEVKALYSGGARPSAPSDAASLAAGPPVGISFQAEISSPSEFANSFYVYVDGKESEAQIWQQDVNAKMHRSSVSPTFPVRPGKHTLTIKGREDNMKIRNVYMLDGKDCAWDTPEV